jgi:hypothetical protein
MSVHYKFFRGTLASWDKLFQQASDFATKLGKEKLINISHSADGGDGVVLVLKDCTKFSKKKKREP